MARKPKYNAWLLMWCSEGIEQVINITELQALANEEEKSVAWELLKAEDPSKVETHRTVKEDLDRRIHMMMLRAKTNTQRHYEIYSVGLPSEMTVDDIMGLFDNDPQTIVDLIREKGHKYYSDRATKKASIV